jgi:hypothetical protein
LFPCLQNTSYLYAEWGYRELPSVSSARVALQAETISLLERSIVLLIAGERRFPSVTDRVNSKDDVKYEQKGQQRRGPAHDKGPSAARVG